MYEILLTSSAVKDYKKIPDSDVKFVNDVIDGLAENPRPPRYKKLKNRSAYRIRIRDYRIIYEIKDDKLIVLIIRIRHRKEVYRTLPE